MPDREVEVLCYAQTGEGDRRACCGALDSEQCEVARSFHDTVKYIDPSHVSLQGSEPLRCPTGIWSGQGDRYTGADKRAVACIPHQPPTRPPLSQGCSQASDSSGRGIGSPKPQYKASSTAPVQDDEAGTTLSGGSSFGSAKEENKMGTAQVALGEPPQQRRGKRKLPVPDLDAIEDPAELRVQRRLLKNRRTAAASRERKQKEMDDLVAHVQALKADNKQLRQALRQRNAQICMLRIPASSRRGSPLPAALGPMMPAPAAHPVFLGNGPLRQTYPASSPPRQLPWQVLGSPGQPAARSGVLSGQPHELLWHGVRELPGGCADVPQLGQPLPHGCGSLPSSLSRTDLNLVCLCSLCASGLSSAPHPSFDTQHCISQTRCLVPPSSHAHPVHDLDSPSPFGAPTGAMIGERASSCPDLPPVGPAVEPVGGTHRNVQLLRSQSGSYPQMARHVPALVDNHAAISATDISFFPLSANPDVLEQLDFYSFWRGLA
ncbi:g5211 [Coccomyxa elongata]